MPGVKGRSGGARLNSGQKKRDPEANWLSGHVRKRPDAVPVMPAGEATCPDDLSDDAKRVWAELAPHARAEGTLTERTASAFADLCRCVVWANDLAASVE